MRVQPLRDSIAVSRSGIADGVSKHFLGSGGAIDNVHKHSTPDRSRTYAFGALVRRCPTGICIGGVLTSVVAPTQLLLRREKSLPARLAGPKLPDYAATDSHRLVTTRPASMPGRNTCPSGIAAMAPRSGPKVADCAEIGHE